MKSKLQKGQTLLEVLVALAFISIVASAFIALGASALRNGVVSRNQQNADKLAQDEMENLLVIRDQSSTVGLTPWGNLFVASCTSSVSLDVTQYPSLVSSGCVEPLEESIPLNNNTITFSRKVRVFDQTGDTPLQIKSFVVLVQWTDQAGDHTTNVIRKIGKDKFQ